MPRSLEVNFQSAIKECVKLVVLLLADGSYLWSWQRAQPTVEPSHTVPRVLVRSNTCSTRNSSLSMPPSRFVRVLRLNPVAIF